MNLLSILTSKACHCLQKLYIGHMLRKLNQRKSTGLNKVTGNLILESIKDLQFFLEFYLYRLF